MFILFNTKKRWHINANYSLICRNAIEIGFFLDLFFFFYFLKQNSNVAALAGMRWYLQWWRINMQLYYAAPP
jgi:hypothetical protein